MVLGWIGFWVLFACSLRLWGACFDLFRVERLSKDASRRRKEMEVGTRMTACLHASFLVVCGTAHFVGLLDEGYLWMIRAFADGYLVYDFWYALEQWRRTHRTSSLLLSPITLLAPAFLGLVCPFLGQGARDTPVGRHHTRAQSAQSSPHSSSSSSSSSSSTPLQSSSAQPVGVAFHHIVTIAWMHGWLLIPGEAGMLIYCLSEVPVVLLNISWLMMYHEGQSSRASVSVSGMAVVTYFVFRVLLFFATFLFIVLPRVHFLNPFSWFALGLLGIVWLMNLRWFVLLTQRNLSIMPQVLDQVFMILSLPQYSAWVPQKVCGVDVRQNPTRRHVKQGIV